jgi:hypothetical protein
MNISAFRGLIGAGFVIALLLGCLSLNNPLGAYLSPEMQEKEAAKEAKVVRSPAELAAIEAMRKQSALVLELAQNDPRLEVSYLQTIEKFGDAQLAPLKDIKGLVRLNLRGQAVTDDLTKHLEGLKDLTHLHLEKTKITDKGLASVKGLSNLEYLNIYGTAVTDAGLKNLEDLKKLRAVYVWQTKVTKEGATALKKVLPKTEVNRGLDDLPPLPKVEEKKGEMKKDGKKEGKKDGKKGDMKTEPKKTEPKKAEEKKAVEKKAEEKKAEVKKEAEKKIEQKKAEEKK